jgi:hypothetical protein
MLEGQVVQNPKSRRLSCMMLFTTKRALNDQHSHSNRSVSRSHSEVLSLDRLRNGRNGEKGIICEDNKDVPRLFAILTDLVPKHPIQSSSWLDIVSAVIASRDQAYWSKEVRSTFGRP